MAKQKVQIRFSHADSGNCREYYRTIRGDGSRGQLICHQDEGENFGGKTWYSATDDNCWEEPISRLILTDIELELVK